MKKKIIIAAVILVVVLVVVFWFIFSKNSKEEYKTAQVVLGEIVKEVSETGAIKVSERLDLSFKYSGRIENIYAEKGNEISLGQNLAKMETDQFYIELAEAEAALEVAQADYNKLLAGSSPEEIQVAKTEVDNAQVALENAEQNLKDIEADAAEDIYQAYEDAVDDLDDAYLKLYNAYNDILDIQRDYFTSTDQESLNFKESKNTLKSGIDDSKTYIDEARADYEKSKIDTALTKVKEILVKARDALIVARNMTEATEYRDDVPAASKTTIDNHKSYINTAYSNIVSASQTISSTEITNETNINTAQAVVSSAEVALQKAKDQLTLKQAGPTAEDIALYSAKIKQAQARASILNNKIQESVLKSPGSGQIIEIYKREGEIVQPAEPIMSFLAKGPFQVEADIYEEDIVEVRVGNTVKITIPAFEEDVLSGQVVSIDPAEKMINGVVYYEVTIDLIDSKQGIKPGMTADIVIETERKGNILIVPKNAVERENGTKIVKVLENGKIESKQVQTGIEGEGLVEIVFGLSEGDTVIID